MYRLGIRGSFDAAHRITGHPGKCANLHGHSWEVEVSLSGENLDNLGMVVDFSRLKAELNRVLDRYDHRNLCEVPPFDVLNPTAENLARIIFEQLIDADFPPGTKIEEVRIRESPDTWASYRSGS